MLCLFDLNSLLARCNNCLILSRGGPNIYPFGSCSICNLLYVAVLCLFVYLVQQECRPLKVVTSEEEGDIIHAQAMLSSFSGQLGVHVVISALIVLVYP